MLELAIGIVSLLTIIAGWYFSRDKREKDEDAKVLENINKVIRESKNIEDVVIKLNVTERNELLKRFLRK